MFKRVAFMMAGACLSIGIHAQTRISGRVIAGDDREPLIGAAIEGDGAAAVTDLDGNFSLVVPGKSRRVTVSYVGYRPLTVEGEEGMTLVMTSDNTLDDVVVIAYGTTRSRDLTGVISTVRGDQLKNLPNASLDEMLSGRAAGTMVTTPSSSVGVAPVINIRGVASITNSTTPLYVVDGMIISTDATSVTRQNPVSDLNPADIKSIEILKDAAATALYGSRAANGVVMITTRSGEKGRSKLSYSGSGTFSDATGMFDVMNARQYVETKNLGVQNTALRTDDAQSFYDSNAYGFMYDSQGNVADTRWRDYLFQTGYAQRHDVNFSGGSEAADCYLGAGFIDQRGITVGDTFKRFSFTANASFRASEWLRAGFSGSYANSRQKSIDDGYGSGVYSLNGFSRMAMILPPDIPAYREDGTPYMESGGYLGYGNNKQRCTYYNPVSYIDEQASTMDNNRVIASGFAELNPVKGLTLKTQYGIDWLFTDSNELYSPRGGDGYDSGGLLSTYIGSRKSWVWTNTLNYRHDFGEAHHVAATLGTEAQRTVYRRRSYRGSHLLDPTAVYIESSYQTYSRIGSRFDARSILSYFGRISYNYRSRYYVEGSLRRDGLSSLGRKWGNFWGVSASWRISDEPFFVSLKEAVNDLRLKGGYGIVGNTNVGFYASQSTYALSYYNGEAAYYPSVIADQRLGWEQSAKTDIGVTGQFLYRFDFEATYFRSESKDLILSSRQAYSTGIPGASITTNMGKMRNQGVELSVGGRILRHGDFSWDSHLNLTLVHNKVLKLENDIIMDDTGANNITTEGKSLGQLYVYPTAGIDPGTGRRVVLLDDENGDPTRRALLVYTQGSGVAVYDPESGERLNFNDWNPHISGNTKPTYYGGWLNTFRYKGFEATALFQYSGGNKLYNGTKATLSDGRFWNNSADYFKHVWRQAGDKAVYAKPELNDNYSNGSANAISDWIENGSYVRLKNLTLGYRFDTGKWPSRLGISVLHLYLEASNLFCLTGYSGLDPEVNSRADSYNTASGIDKNTTPMTRSYTIGLNITF